MDDEASLPHVTVLLQEAVAALALIANGTYLDCTFGRGGHSRLILAGLGAGGRLIAIDRDQAAVAAAAAITDARFVVRMRVFRGWRRYWTSVVWRRWMVC